MDLRDSSFDTSNRVDGFIDSRWEKIIRPRVPELTKTMLPHSCMDNFFKFGLVTDDEMERLIRLTNKEAALHLLVFIFPRKGPDSYAKFLKALKATEGQEYIALRLEEDANDISTSEREEGQRPLAAFLPKKEKKRGDSSLKPERVDEVSSASLEVATPDARSATCSSGTEAAKETLRKKELIELVLRMAILLSPAESRSCTCKNTISALPVQAKEESSTVIINSLTKKLMRATLENIALRRIALTPGKRGPLAPPESRSWTWKTISALPVRGECDPYNAAVCIDKTLTVRYQDWMLYWHLHQQNWDKFRVIPVNINLRNVFRCGNRCCVIGKDINDKKLKLYEWVYNSELQLITVLPKEHQLGALSAIGDERNNVYIVGGEVEKGSYSKKVSCYNTDSNLWETMPDMPTGRKWCSLAILDNYLYVGGGDTIEGPSKLFQRLPLSTGRDSKWKTLPSTTVKDCKLTAFCGKIVATGGQYRSTVFEVYMCDETDETNKAWLQLPPLNVGRSAHGVCVSGNVLLVVGGHRAKNSIEAFAV